MAKGNETSAVNVRLWKELYAVAEQIGKMNPWAFFNQMMPIGLELRAAKEKVIAAFSTEGMFARRRTLAIYHGEKGLFDYDQVYQENSCAPREFVIFDRNAWVLRWGARDEMLPAQVAVTRAIGKSYRGADRWLQFAAHESRRMPRLPSDAEAETILAALGELQTALIDHLNEKIEVDYDRGRYLCRAYDAKKRRMATKTALYSEPPCSFRVYNFNDEVLRRRLKKAKATGGVIDFDFFYNGWLPLEEIGGPAGHNLLLFAAIDEDTGEIVRMMPVMPEAAIGEMVLAIFHDCIVNEGRMKEIAVRHHEAFLALQDICREIGVKLALRPLPAADRLLNEIRSGI